MHGGKPIEERLTEILGSRQAKRALGTHDLDYLEEKLAILGNQDPTNPAAFLSKAIAEDWKPMSKVTLSPAPQLPLCYYCRQSIGDHTKAREAGNTVRKHGLDITYPACQSCGKTQPYSIG